MKNFIEIIASFQHLKIAVFGDLMLDKYILGKVERISPEAPIPIVLVEAERFALGGAANVAANVSSMKAEAYLFGMLGEDDAGEIFLQKCSQRNIQTNGLFRKANQQTIQKIRVIGQHQQLLRIDYENKGFFCNEQDEFYLRNLYSIPKLDAIIISDYAKGAISENLMENLKEYANQKKIKLVVDPKPKHKQFYRNVDLITPNLKEAQELSAIRVESLQSLVECGKNLNEQFQCDVIITTGEKGMSIFPLDCTPEHISTKATEVYDVSGAGDTVVAAITLAMASGADLHTAAELANIAAGIKVKKLGTAPVEWEELQKNIS